MNIILWAFQILLGLAFLGLFGFPKAFQPVMVANLILIPHQKEDIL